MSTTTSPTIHPTRILPSPSSSLHLSSSPSPAPSATPSPSSPPAQTPTTLKNPMKSSTAISKEADIPTTEDPPTKPTTADPITNPEEIPDTPSPTLLPTDALITANQALLQAAEDNEACDGRCCLKSAPTECSEATSSSSLSLAFPARRRRIPVREQSRARLYPGHNDSLADDVEKADHRSIDLPSRGVDEAGHQAIDRSGRGIDDTARPDREDASVAVPRKWSCDGPRSLLECRGAQMECRGAQMESSPYPISFDDTAKDPDNNASRGIDTPSTDKKDSTCGEVEKDSEESSPPTGLPDAKDPGNDGYLVSSDIEAGSAGRDCSKEKSGEKGANGYENGRREESREESADGNEDPSRKRPEEEKEEDSGDESRDDSEKEREEENEEEEESEEESEDESQELGNPPVDEREPTDLNTAANNLSDAARNLSIVAKHILAVPPRPSSHWKPQQYRPPIPMTYGTYEDTSDSSSDDSGPTEVIHGISPAASDLIWSTPGSGLETFPAFDKMKRMVGDEKSCWVACELWMRCCCVCFTRRGRDGYEQLD
ncbi:MAG: hypothetical protein L6R42_008714 [Xanthoria sp. 1 TBL-2021]|nr:MAG: hypothetical protein L6R42_008714 [Xanthoria sp. 1 TBL-2021]